MVEAKLNIQAGFWQGKKVLLTGHTGFKGSWMASLLDMLGAEVTGISLEPEREPALWQMVSDRFQGVSHIVDIRNKECFAQSIRDANPEIVIHMAAQALVRHSYHDPTATFTTNVGGTINLLDILQFQEGLRSVIIVTSDKVYKNDEKANKFSELDPLGGDDPYSASKAAAELVTRAYAESIFNAKGIPIATVRAGNVIGGGDWSTDRLVPDIYRSIISQRPLSLRYPNAYRPWQHVLDCINGYLLFVEFLTTQSSNTVPSLNFGPSAMRYPTVVEIAELISHSMGAKIQWVVEERVEIEEKQTLALDTSLAQKVIGWQPKLDLQETIRLTAEWYAGYSQGIDALELMQLQIRDFWGC